MTEQEAFVLAIAEDPQDDGVRLVFADWLEEHDDPLGEFIRLQIALEPLRCPCFDPLAELERVRRLERIPPGKDFSDDDWPLARQLQREQDLLREHRSSWLGEAAALGGEHSNHFKPEFRRGFVGSAEIGLTALVEHGEAVRRACPVLQRFVVFGTLGRGWEIASCSAVGGLPELLVAGWLNAADATALAGSPHLAGLRSLTIWIGADEDEAVCRSLSRLPDLRELTLVQMWGGIAANDPERLDERADELAALARRQRPGCQVQLVRPFARRFPLDGVHIGHGIDAGYLPGGQPVLVEESKQPVVIYFDGEGKLLHEDQLDLRDKLFKRPAYSWEDSDAEELIEVLGREIGFEPGPIFVREFWSQRSDVGVECWDMYQEELSSPGTTDPEEGEDIGRSLYWWWSTSEFVLPFGNQYWADGLGRIHSS
jgi:uncharacterized protein (TIGR02996 family)